MVGSLYRPTPGVSSSMEKRVFWLDLLSLLLCRSCPKDILLLFELRVPMN